MERCVDMQGNGNMVEGMEQTQIATIVDEEGKMEMEVIGTEVIVQKVEIQVDKECSWEKSLLKGKKMIGSQIEAQGSTDYKIVVVENDSKAAMQQTILSDNAVLLQSATQLETQSFAYVETHITNELGVKFTSDSNEIGTEVVQIESSAPEAPVVLNQQEFLKETQPHLFNSKFSNESFANTNTSCIALIEKVKKTKVLKDSCSVTFERSLPDFFCMKKTAKVATKKRKAIKAEKVVSPEPLVKEPAFLEASPIKCVNKKRKQNVKNSINFDYKNQVSHIFDGLFFMVTGFKASYTDNLDLLQLSLEEKFELLNAEDVIDQSVIAIIEEMGGAVMTRLPDYGECPYIILISGKPTTTLKYLFGLARGVPPLRTTWLKAFGSLFFICKL